MYFYHLFYFVASSIFSYFLLDHLLPLFTIVSLEVLIFLLVLHILDNQKIFILYYIKWDTMSYYTNLFTSLTHFSNTSQNKLLRMLFNFAVPNAKLLSWINWNFNSRVLLISYYNKFLLFQKSVLIMLLFQPQYY